MKNCDEANAIKVTAITSMRNCSMEKLASELANHMTKSSLLLGNVATKNGTTVAFSRRAR